MALRVHYGTVVPLGVHYTPLLYSIIVRYCTQLYVINLIIMMIEYHD